MARLPVYLADLRDDPKWLLMFITGRVVMIRRAVSLMTRSLAPPETPGTMFPSVDAGTVAGQLRKDGISCGLQLPEPIVQGIRAFAERTHCFGNLDRNAPFLARDHRSAETAFNRPIL